MALSLRSVVVLVGVMVGAMPWSGWSGLPEGWRFVGALPQANHLHAAWAPAPGTVFVGGEAGTVMRWDAAGWTVLDPPTQRTIFGLHGTSATDLWAVGGDPYELQLADRDLILHFDGTRWERHPAPLFSDTSYIANAVHAIATNDVWITIDGGTYLQHYDGQRWDWVPISLSVEGTLRGLASLGPEHLFVVGSHGQILHRDQGTWKLEQKTEDGHFSMNLLSTVWARDLDHVYAGGNLGQVYHRQSDGTWRDLGLGGGIFGGDSTLAIWEAEPDRLWLLGGAALREYTGLLPATTWDFYRDLRRFWSVGTAAGDRFYAVGALGVVHELLRRGPGESPVVSPLTVGDSRPLPLNLAGAVSLDERRLVVWGSTLHIRDPWPFLVYSESGWERFPTLPPGMKPETILNGVYQPVGTTQWVVAWDNFSDLGRGVHRWDGQQWQALGSWEAPSDAIAFWESPTGALYAATPWRVARWKDGVWQSLKELTFEETQEIHFSALGGRSDTEVYLGSREGRIQRFDGTTWHVETVPNNPAAVLHLVGRNADLYALGEGGLAWRRGTTSWTPLNGVEVRSGDVFTHVVTGRQQLIAVQTTASGIIGGGLSRLWRIDGSNALRLAQGLPSVQAAGSTTLGSIYALAERDAILTDHPLEQATALLRLDLSRSEWQPMANLGVALRVVEPRSGQPLVAVRREPQAVPGFNPPTDSEWSPAGEHWTLTAETSFAGPFLPAVQVRFHWDPERTPAGAAMSEAKLFRSDGLSWEAVGTQVNLPDGWLETSGPTPLSTWTYATPVGVPEAPALRFQATAPGARFSWPATATGWVLETSPSLGTGANWTPSSAAAEVIEGHWTVSVPTLGPGAYYRLRADDPAGSPAGEPAPGN